MRRKLQIFWLIWLIIITAAALDSTYLMWLATFTFFFLLFIVDLMFLNDGFIYDPTSNSQVTMPLFALRLLLRGCLLSTLGE